MPEQAPDSVPAQARTFDQKSIDAQAKPFGQWLRQHWRFYIFVVFAIIGVVLGFVFRNAAAPATTEQGSPVSFSVVTTDPNAHVELAAKILWLGITSRTGTLADVQLSLLVIPSNRQADIEWLILAHTGLPPSNTSIPVVRAKPLNIDGSASSGPQTPQTYELLAGDSRELVPHPRSGDPFPWTSSAGSFNFANSSITTTHGDLTASLPQVGMLTNYPSASALVLESSISTGNPVSAVITRPLDEQPIGTDPYQVPGESAKKFYNPQTITTDVDFTMVRPFFQNSQATSMVPADGQLRGDDLWWTSNQTLQPNVRTVSFATAEARSNFDFYSGIALATAAAAVIAAVQELPPTLPWVRRRTAGVDNENERPSQAAPPEPGSMPPDSE